ncbi:hypothetical protein Tco_0985730 [Tanacetum coccineum]
MDDPDIAMEEYIQLEAEKARMRGQEFNWEIDTYGKVRCFEDINYFKDFKNEFSAIVYKYALTFEPKVSSKPTEPSGTIESIWWNAYYLEFYACVVRAKIQTVFRTHILAHKRNMKDHTEQISGEFYVLIL